MKELICIVLFAVFALSIAKPKPQGNGFNSGGGYNFNPPGPRGNQGIANAYLPSQSPSFSAPRSNRPPTYPVPPAPPRPAPNFQSNSIPIGISNSNNVQSRPQSPSSLPVSPFPSSTNVNSNLPVSPFPASNGGSSGGGGRLPVSPFAASTGGNNQLTSGQFPSSNFGSNSGGQQFPAGNSYGPPPQQFGGFGAPQPVYGAPVSNDLFEELPQRSMNGRLMGAGSYTFIGKDGVTRAIEGEMMFQATGRRTRKLGIPSAAVASLAGGGLG